MKIRSGFVSNSSSSSFVCDISGGVEAGQDGQGYDHECCVCENGHSFYSEYLLVDNETVKNLTVEEKRIEINREYHHCRKQITAFLRCDKAQTDEVYLTLQDISDEQINALHASLLQEEALLSWTNNFDYGSEHYVSSARCPICQLLTITKDMAFKYVKKEFFDNDESRLFKAIQERFGSYEEFDNYLKGLK